MEKPPLRSRKWRDYWSAGQSVAQVKEIRPAAAIVAGMVEEYYETCLQMENTINQH
jgi:NAD(P)H-dependent flavin oxidoreductase YrpB (nitropropane dioxygenase family)